MQETWVRSLGWEDPLEKEKATHSSILAWRIPWTEEPGGLQSMRLQRVGHNSETKQQQGGSAGFLCVRFAPCIRFSMPLTPESDSLACVRCIYVCSQTLCMWDGFSCVLIFNSWNHWFVYLILISH